MELSRKRLIQSQEKMPSYDNYQNPTDADAPTEPMDPELVAAQQAWIDGELTADVSAHDVSEEGDSNDGNADQGAVDALATEFVDRWHQLVSQTNWEKGRIISQWRLALIESGAPATAYSDEAWAKQVGGVTAPHVGRLRRVFDQFGDTCETYPSLSWTHFLAAMDWDDAPLWLQGAIDAKWSVSGMRKQRWETLGGAPEYQPLESDVMATDLDEDFVAMPSPSYEADPSKFTQPAQGGSSARKDDDEPSGITSGPISEGPDFGDESLQSASAPGNSSQDEQAREEASNGVLVQPFAGLPALPDDLADAVELLKLAIVQHKATGWQSVELDTVRNYLTAFLVLIDARSR
jgi:hypothetical protein